MQSLTLMKNAKELFSEMDRSNGRPSAVVRVAMIVTNPCANDSRVIKEAESLAAAGYKIRVVCRQADGLEDFQIINGVEYCRVHWPKSFRLLFGLYCGRIMGAPANSKRYGILDSQSDRSRGTAAPEGIEAPEADLSGPIKVALRAAYRIFRAAYRVFRTAYRVVIRKHLVQFLQFDVAHLFARDVLERWRPQIIHAHDLITLPAAVKIGRKIGAHVIYDAHELEQHRNPPKSWLWRKWVAYHEKKYAPACSAVITVSESIADHLERELDIRRPEVILNSPKVATEHQCSRDLRSDLNLANDIPLAVYVGGVTINRGLERLFEALRFTDKFHLALVGARNLAVEQSLRAISHQYDLASRVHFVDPVAPHDVVPYIAAADVGVYAIPNVCLSYDYCAPNKLFEMLFAGLPMAVSNLTETRRLMSRMSTGLLMDQSSPISIAGTLDTVYSKRSQLKPSEAHMQEMIREFGWETQSKKLISLYSKVWAFSQFPHTVSHKIFLR